MMEQFKGLTVKEFFSKTDSKFDNAKLQIVTGEFGQDLLFLSDCENYHIEWLLDRVIESVTDQDMEDGWLKIKVIETQVDVSRRSRNSYIAYVGGKCSS